ncbi:MAG: hypothetical protein PVH84_12360 [Candidatus Aminicenantes bacterium]
MWRILKAEILYERSRLLIVSVFYLTCLVIIWFGVKWERNVSPLTMLIVFISSLVAVYAGEQGRILNKRDRMHVSLPVSLWKTGFSHLIYPASVWMAILLLYQVSSAFLEVFSGTTRLQPSFSQILTLSGLFLIVNAAILLSRDLSKIFTKKSQQIIIYMTGYLLFISALLPFYILTNFFGVFGENTRLQSFASSMSESPFGFLLVGFGFSALSLFVFIRRNSYAHS